LKQQKEEEQDRLESEDPKNKTSIAFWSSQDLATQREEDESDD